jgi:hypothetical protein
MTADFQVLSGTGSREPGSRPEVEPLALFSPSPNPCRGSATVLYRLEDAGRVTLSVHDVVGREIARLDDGARRAGTHRVALDAAALTSGVYFVRLRAAGHEQSRKFLVVR